LTFDENDEFERISAKKLNRMRKRQIISEMKKPVAGVDPPGEFDFCMGLELIRGDIYFGSVCEF
jgi:hypothetical protein